MVSGKAGDFSSALDLMTDDVVFMTPGESHSERRPSPPLQKT